MIIPLLLLGRNESKKRKMFSLINSPELNYLEQANDNMHCLIIFQGCITD